MSKSIRHIPANLFRDLAEFYSNRYMAVLPPDISFEDLFQPNMWAHYGGPKVKKGETPQSRFCVNDIIRVVAEDGSFDLDLTVADHNVGSVTMKIRPYFGNLSGDAAIAKAREVAESKPGVVPLGRDGKPTARVDHLPATGWRVIGVEGEVSRGHASKVAAQAALEDYLKKAHLVMPEPETEAKAKAESKADKAA